MRGADQVFYFFFAGDFFFSAVFFFAGDFFFTAGFSPSTVSFVFLVTFFSFFSVVFLTAFLVAFFTGDLAFVAGARLAFLVGCGTSYVRCSTSLIDLFGLELMV